MVELFINGTDTAVGQVTLFGDEPLSLNISVGDIRDISKRNSSYSQTFVVPADKNNNILFNHIFNIGSDSSFDPRTKTSCYILNDNISVFSGNFQLTKINVQDRNVLSYECVVYGEMVDLVKVLGDKLITDLDFTELNHVSTSEVIMASWTASTKDLGYYYPLIDYGYDLSLNSLNPGVQTIQYETGLVSVGTQNALRDNSKNWTVNSFVGMQVNITNGTGIGQSITISSNNDSVLILLEDWSIIPDASSTYTITKIDTSNPWSLTDIGMKPSMFKAALSNKYLFDKILLNAGFSYESDILNSDVFTETIIPYNGTSEIKLTEAATDYMKFMVSTTVDYATINLFTPSFPYNTNNPNGYYNNSTKKYTSPVNANMQFGFRTTYSFTGTPASSNTIVVKFYRTGWQGGSYPFYEEQARVDPNTVTNVKYNLSILPPPLDDPNSQLFFPVLAGEKIWVTTQFTPYAPSVGLVYHAYNPATPQYHGTQFYNIPGTSAPDGGLCEFNSVVPKNIKQVDYIKSIITMFNLMVIPDKYNPKRLSFVTRSIYYNSGEVKDWTDKIDNNDKINATLISEQQSKAIILSYKSDSDSYNTYYTDNTKKVYGEYKNILDNEWVVGTNKIEVIFSPTPMDSVNNTNDIIVPKIGKRDSNGVFGKSDSNIRFLRKNPVPTPITSTITLKGTPSYGVNVGLTVNYYPYAGHLDNAFNSTIDYNFGSIDFAFYTTPGSDRLNNITPNNLVESYWRDYLDDINDKNSKLIKCKVYLTPDDIARFNYNDSIYIEGLTDDGGHYFIVNNINYIPTSNLPSIVELIKVNRITTSNTESYSLETPIKKNTIKSFNTLILGDNVTESTNTIISGVNNYIGKNSEGSIVSGYGNTIQEGSSGFIVGDNNTIKSGVTNTFILGSNVTATETGVTYIGGEIVVVIDEISASTDEILNPFSSNLETNEISGSRDCLRELGSRINVQSISGGRY